MQLELRDPAPTPIPFQAAVWVWVRVACLSFGGPAGQIAVMHRILVEEKRWISEARFLHALQFCTLLPGPEAQQLATYLGWLLHRTRGGLVAGLLFILPGALAMFGLSALYVASFGVDWIEAIFFGIQTAVLAIVMEALLRLSRRARKRPHAGWLAVAAFVALFFFEIAFPFVIIAAALAGLGLMRSSDGKAHSQAVEADPVPLAEPPPATWQRATKLVLGLGLLWALPFLVFDPNWGFPTCLRDVAWFFSQCAVVTFGGAYAVLAYVAERAVQDYAWLQPEQMIAGLGLAETTPGPLILVLQFVAFLGGWNHPGAFAPWLTATLAAGTALWVSFVPCFLWIFLGAPYIERLRGNHALQAALGAISAAVVGVIANLSVWFGLHVWFDEIDAQHKFGVRLLWPRWESIDGFAVALSLLGFVALLRWKLGLGRTLLLTTSLGFVGKILMS